MTCSLQTYRIRIGTFQSGIYLKKKTTSCTRNSNLKVRRTSFILALIISNYCLIALTFPALLQPHPPHHGPTWHQQHSHHGSYTIPISSLANIRSCGFTSKPVLIIPDSDSIHQNSRQSRVWDPGANANSSLLQSSQFILARTCPWETHKKRNKVAHIMNGNIGQRGKGVTCVYWNKGPSFLTNKMNDIESIIDTHKPHILGLGEANFRHDHDVEDVQLQGYTLHLDSSVRNPNLGIARVVVYTHNILRVKRRADLEDDTIAAVWLECGLPSQKSFLVCVGQADRSSASVSEQLARWTVFLDMWERALQEDKEVIVTLDANIDHITWRMQDSLSQHSSSVKLKSLMEALLTRIIPHGVAQMVNGDTRIERGQPRTELDHLEGDHWERIFFFCLLFWQYK